MDWTTTLKTLAPTVATALLGPLGGAAVAAIGSAIGVSEPTQDKIAKIFQDGQLTSENVAELRKLELQYQNDEKERDFRYSELSYKDTESARSMAVQTKSATPTVLSYGVLGGGGFFLGAVLFGYAKVDSVLAGTLVGYIVSEMKQVLQFWLGSSAGSKESGSALADIAKRQV